MAVRFGEGKISVTGRVWLLHCVGERPGSQSIYLTVSSAWETWWGESNTPSALLPSWSPVTYSGVIQNTYCFLQDRHQKCPCSGWNLDFLICDHFQWLPLFFFSIVVLPYCELLRLLTGRYGANLGWPGPRADSSSKNSPGISVFIWAYFAVWNLIQFSGAGRSSETLSVLYVNNPQTFPSWGWV